MANYYLKYNDRVSGPFPLDKLKSMAEDGLVTSAHAVSPDRENWIPVGGLAGLLPDVHAPIPQPPPASATPAIPPPVSTIPPLSPVPAPSIAPIEYAASAGGTAIPPPIAVPPVNPTSAIPPPVAPNPIVGMVRGIMNGGRINLKVTMITCMVAVVLSLILGVATMVIRGQMDRVQSRLDSDYYSWGNPNNVLGPLKLRQEYDGLSTSSTVHCIIAGIQSLALLAYFVFWMIPLYQCWKTVEPLRAQDPNIPSPGKAVGFLLIPFFGLYWMFPSLTGLGKHLNTMNRFRNPDPPRPDNTLIQGLGIGVGVASIVTGLAMMTSNNSIQSMLMLTVWLLLSFFYIKNAVDIANQLPSA